MPAVNLSAKLNSEYGSRVHEGRAVLVLEAADMTASSMPASFSSSAL